MGGRALFGRRVIYTDVAAINDNNIVDVLQKALFIHLMNQADISYLYRYYNGRSAGSLPEERSSA